jgi:DNA uptake protein ComE-like DNA-binding protein
VLFRSDRFENQQTAAYAKIVKDYPLSVHADAASQELKAMNRPVPEADPVAYARMKYELENHNKPGVMSHFWGVFRSRPDMSQAAKSGTPPMTGFRPTVAYSVPPTAAGALGVSADVSVSTVSDTSALDQNPDARANPPAQAAADQPAAAPAAPAAAVTRSGVDLNIASEKELQKLPGVGKALAKRIVAGRPYVSIDDLKKVGVAQKTIDQIRPLAAGSATPGASKK